jgi:phenylacetate-coenzyme A ligase PaaK-like adenylate-forming protein
MLAHAQAHSPFHAARLADIDPPAFQLEDLEALPSMTKDRVMDAWDEVVTDRELHLQDVASHLDGENKCVSSGQILCGRDGRVLR